MVTKSAEDDPFDAVAAAEELAAALGSQRDDPPADGDRDQVIRQLEQDIADMSAFVETAGERARKAELRAEHALAEVEAIKERLRKDAARELERRTRAVLLGFIEVLDDLDRALEAARKTDGHAAVLEGIELVREHFRAKLAEYGVQRIPALGERFDPTRHDGITVVRVASAAHDGKVVAVMREGYLIGDEVLRPAGVAVGRAG